MESCVFITLLSLAGLKLILTLGIANHPSTISKEKFFLVNLRARTRAILDSVAASYHPDWQSKVIEFITVFFY